MLGYGTKDERREVGNILELLAQIYFSLEPWVICFGTLGSWDGL